MSFGGGGSADYRINYIISTKAEGTAAGPLNQVSAATDKMAASNQKASVSAEQLKSAHERVTQAHLGVSKAAKGMTFGIIGMTTAGAEMVGMLSMWQATQDGVREAQEHVNKALAEGGKGSTEYTKATQELAKANRWAQMTFRNLLLSVFDMIPFIVLTVNGLTKLRTALTALREAKAAEAALQAVATSTNAVTASTKTFTATQAAANIQTTASAGAFKNQTISLGTATAATNTHTAAQSRLRSVMSGMLKVMLPIGAALGAGAVAAIAYKNNIGGLRTVFDEVGSAIGNAVPQLQGFLNKIKELALAFPDLGKMWDIITGKNKEAGLGEIAPSEEEIKRIEELNEAVKKFENESVDFITEISRGDRGEQRDFMKALGLDKDARKDMDETLDKIEETQDTLLNFHNSIKTMQALNIFQKFGLDVPNDMWKEIAKGLSKQFKNLGKMFPGDDMFDEFAKVLKKASKKKGPAVVKDIFAFLKENPDFMPMLKEWQPELYQALQDIIDQAATGHTIDLSDTVVEIDPNTLGQEVKDALGITETVSEAEKAGEEIVKGLITGFENVNWNKVKTTLRMQIMDPLITSLETIGANIIPIVKTAINNNINKGITTEDASGKVTGIDWEGLWNSILETAKTASGGGAGDLGVGKATWWKKNVEPRITAFWDQLTNVENWNRYAEEKKNQFMEIPKLAWAHVENAFATYILEPLDWLNDQAVKFIEQLTSVENWNKYFEQKKAAFAEIPKLLWAHIENAFANTLVGKGINALIDLAKKSLFGQAEGAGTTPTVPFEFNVQPQYTILQPTPKKSMIIGEGSRFGKSGTLFPSSLTQWAKNVQIPAISADVPIDPKKIIINPPTGQNATPTITGPNGIMPSFTTPTATIQPVSATVDISGSTKQVTDSGGPAREGSGFPGTWAGVYALYIDYPGTVGIKPQSVAFDITEADLEVGVATFQAIAVEADKTKQFIVNAYNELAATLASLFATTSQLWSSASAEIGQNAKDASHAIEDEFAKALQNVYDTMVDLGQQWSEIGAEIAQNAADAGQGIINEFESAFDEVISAADDMLGEWSNTMDDMVQAAEDAAEDISNELASIPDEEVKINYVKTGATGKAHGTSGEWVHKPKLFMAGEQGPEFVSVTRAHSKPHVGGDGDGGGDISSTFNGTINLKISGNEIVNPSKLSQKIRMTIGENRDRFG